MTAVTVRADAGKLYVSSPYHAEYISVIRCLGGRWDPAGRTWAVPARQAQALRELLIRVYGADGGIPAPVAKPGNAGAAAAPAAPPQAPPQGPRPSPRRVPTVAEIDRIMAEICLPAPSPT